MNLPVEFKDSLTANFDKIINRQCTGQNIKTGQQCGTKGYFLVMDNGRCWNHQTKEYKELTKKEKETTKKEKELHTIRCDQRIKKGSEYYQCASTIGMKVVNLNGTIHHFCNSHYGRDKYDICDEHTILTELKKTRSTKTTTTTSPSTTVHTSPIQKKPLTFF
jgi:hypothetical protein